MKRNILTSIFILVSIFSFGQKSVKLNSFSYTFCTEKMTNIIIDYISFKELSRDDLKMFKTKLGISYNKDLKLFGIYIYDFNKETNEYELIEKPTVFANVIYKLHKNNKTGNTTYIFYEIIFKVLVPRFGIECSGNDITFKNNKAVKIIFYETNY